MKFLANRLQQFGDSELGIKDISHMAIGRNLLHETAANGGFAGANVASQQHKATASAARRTHRPCYAIQQMGQRLPVALAHEQVTRIGRDGKRVLVQAEVVRVHRWQA